MWIADRGVAIVPGGYAVADAAGNSVLRVGKNGRVSTVAVLPPVEQLITAETVAQFAEEGIDISGCGDRTGPSRCGDCRRQGVGLGRIPVIAVRALTVGSSIELSQRSRIASRMPAWMKPVGTHMITPASC